MSLNGSDYSSRRTIPFHKSHSLDLVHGHNSRGERSRISYMGSNGPGLAVRQQLGRRDHRKRGHSLELDVRMGATADLQHRID